MRVAPGFIESAMTDTLPEEVRTAYLEGIPLKEFGTAQDVADAVKFLVSEQARYITGQVLHVNGRYVHVVTSINAKILY